MPANAQAQSGGKVTIWVGSWWEPQVAVIKQLWTKDHPEIALDIQPLPINGYLDKFTTAALGGSPPDVIDLDTTWVSTVAALGLLQPLDRRRREADRGGHLAGGLERKPVQGRAIRHSEPERTRASTTTTRPSSTKPAFPIRRNDWTYDDFLEIAQKLTIPGQQYGVGVPADVSDPSNVHDDVRPILWAMGGDFLTPDGSAPAINSPQSVKAITFWSDLYLKHKVTPEGTPNFTTTRDIQPLFEANKVGLLDRLVQRLRHVLEEAGAQVGRGAVAREGQPRRRLDHGRPGRRGQSRMAPRPSSLWLSQPEIMAKVMNRFPANRKALDLPPWNDPAKAIFKQAEADGRSVPSVAGWFKMQEAIIVELQRILVGQRTPQQAADAAAAPDGRDHRREQVSASRNA